MRQRSAGQVDALWLNTIPASIQMPQFALNATVGGVDFKGAFHVPDRSAQVAFFVVDDAHAQVRDEIVWHGQQHSQKNIRRISITMGFQIGFSHQAICFKVLGEALEDVHAVSYSLIRMALVNQGFDFSVIGA